VESDPLMKIRVASKSVRIAIEHIWTVFEIFAPERWVMSKLGLFSRHSLFTHYNEVMFRNSFKGMMVLPGRGGGEWHNVKMACIRESSFIS